MTIAEMDRLIRRIEEALERPPANGVLSRLAGEYHTVARAAAMRLNQCGAMLAAGDEHQALQLAETQPALMDQLTLLSFRRSPAWRALCAGENLPVPESFEVKTIRQLGELYAKGIDKDHALYREYRRAVILNDDARALAILRSIARLNPNDTNAITELDRLEKKSRAEKIHKLEKLVRQGDSVEAVAELVEQLEAIPEAARSSEWIPAQTVRAKVLLAQAEKFRSASESGELRQTLQKLSSLAHLLDSNERRILEEHEQWSVADAAIRKEAASRRAAIDEFAAATASLEHEEFLVRRRNLHELRRASEALDRAWNKIEHFRVDVPAELLARAQKLRDSLRAQIERSVRASRRLAFATVGMIVLVCMAAAWFAYSRQAAHALAARLQTMMRERRVTETETALSNANNQLPAEVRSTAADFVAREFALTAAANQAVTNLNAFAQRAFTNAPPEQIAGAFATAKASVAALAPEFRRTTDPALAKVEAAWLGFLDRERAARTARVEAILAPVEAAAERELQYSRDPQAVAAAADKFQTELAPARQITASGVAELRPKPETLARLEALQTRVEKYSRDAVSWFTAQSTLSQAKDIPTYNAAIGMFASSGFTPEEPRAHATALAALNLNATNLLASALLPNAPVSALTEPRSSRLPDEVLPVEREIQHRLREDENINGVSRLTIEAKTLPGDDPGRVRKVFLRGELQRRITRKSGEIYDPRESPAALRFVEKEMGSLDYNVQEPTPTPERDLYQRLDLDRLLDGAGKYQISLLQVLDDINFDRTASPLFRAWLFVRLCEMIDAQPVQWSAIWTPALAQDRTNLVRIGALQIRSGDWFLPAKAAAAPRFTAHFDRVTYSYARQATFFKRLLPLVVQNGLTLVDFIGPDGQRLLNATTNRVLGITAPKEPPRLISMAAPMPFSPLFTPSGNVSQLIGSTLESLGYSGANVGIPNSLPPAFRP